jgi:hypothetical protein
MWWWQVICQGQPAEKSGVNGIVSRNLNAKKAKAGLGLRTQGKGEGTVHSGGRHMVEWMYK